MQTLVSFALARSTARLFAIKSEGIGIRQSTEWLSAADESHERRAAQEGLDYGWAARSGFPRVFERAAGF